MFFTPDAPTGADPADGRKPLVTDRSPACGVGNAPLNYVDPTGHAAETIWDAASLTVGGISLRHNLREGNVSGAVIDAIGMTADAVALVIPFVPGGVGMAIKAVRASGVAVDAMQATRAVNTGIRTAKRTSDVVQTADFFANGYQTYEAYQNRDATGMLFGTLHVGLRGGQGLNKLGYDIQPFGLYGGIPVPRIVKRSEPSGKIFKEYGLDLPRYLELDAPSAKNGHSFVTYVLKDKNKISYVGRASGIGTPREVLTARLSKGHDHLASHLKPEIVDVQASKLASFGAEEVFSQGYRELGMPLTNVIESLSYKSPTRTAKSLSKIEAYIRDLKIRGIRS